MNELSKLISSLLLLGAGFVGAAFVGPPELVGRLSEYLQPGPPSTIDGLRPLASNAPARGTDAWPSLQRQKTPALAVSSAQPAAEPKQESPWGAPVAEVTAMVPPTSWADAETQPRATTISTSTPAGDDWLTADSLDAPAAPQPYDTTPAVGQLTPVERSPSSSTTSPTQVAATEQATAWPELRAPQAPVDLLNSTPSDAAPRLRRLPPTSPYGERPQYDANASTELDRQPLRAEQPAAPIAPVGRQPAEATYTKHVVTDGDTLASLAERYLGEASRAAELFELNRDRLEHPDVLPIGMVLLTPSTPLASSPMRLPPTAGFPDLRPGTSDFATVSSYKPVTSHPDFTDRRELTPIDVPAERPLSEAQSLGPINPHYDHEVSWDANRW